jgi:hypothetical protein
MCEEAIGYLPEFYLLPLRLPAPSSGAAKSSTGAIIARLPHQCHMRRRGTGFPRVHKAVFGK